MQADPRRPIDAGEGKGKKKRRTPSACRAGLYSEKKKKEPRRAAQPLHAGADLGTDLLNALAPSGPIKCLGT
jgi:hypothetical protein